MTIKREGLHVVVRTSVASEMDDGEWDLPDRVHEMEANAELIAQAPDLKQQRDDLLAALKDILAMDADTKGHRKSHPRQTEVTTNS